jgi:hypothetical protein
VGVVVRVVGATEFRYPQLDSEVHEDRDDARDLDLVTERPLRLTDDHRIEASTRPREAHLLEECLGLGPTLPGDRPGLARVVEDHADLADVADHQRAPMVLPLQRLLWGLVVLGRGPSQ